MYDTNLLEDQPIAWTPTPDVIERAQLTKFMRQVGVSTWDELYQFSIRDVEKFTEEVLKFLDIRFDPPYEKLLDTSGGIELPKWLAGAGLNITTMCLDRWQTDEMKDQPAVIWEGEEGTDKSLTYHQLKISVDTYAGILRHEGFTKGDAIGIHLPMMLDTVEVLLAINRIGAIAVPVFSGYGIDAIASRMNAVGAKGLFTFDGVTRRGKEINALEIAREAVSHCPTVKTVFVVGRLAQSDFDCDELSTQSGVKYVDLHDEFYEFGIYVEDHGDSKEYRKAEPTSAEDPLIILYTSGTTGKPKGIAHTHASFPIKAAQDMAFGCDVGRGTRICWYSDLGWMMGPWLIYGALINGATICLYDGAPDYPTPDRMWEFCAKHKVEVLGISPTLVRALASHDGRSEDTPVLMSAKHEESSRLSVNSPELLKSKREESPRKGWSRHGKLPHFDGQVTQFITFRLADSLPKGVLESLKLELKHADPEVSSGEYWQQVEEYLDKGAGECLLRDPKIAEIVTSTILSESGKSCDLKAWVVMPNHVHLLLRMLDGSDLSGLMKRIKGISARRINEALGRVGTVWQANYFDRYIRNADHYVNVFQYIENNPVLGALVNEPAGWQFSSAAARSQDAPVPVSEKPEHRLAASGDGDKSVPAPYERHDLSSLRAFGSTGEPWNPGPWWWLFKEVGNSKLPIINYSGGTEISGGILMGNPLLPIKPCSFPAPCPGMDVDIVDENGDPVGPNEVGELVIKQPWIGMARGFWQEKERYLETYWSRFKNIWVHGDWAMRDSDGHWFILGRSDDTLKVAGKRVGPAEVESILVSHPLVTEAAVIGVPDESKGTAMVGFCVLSNVITESRGDTTKMRAETLPSGSEADVNDRLETELKALVARDMGKPLAPSKIHFVSALPKTRNAKVMRRVLRAAYLGEDAGDLSALENPRSVEEIRSVSNA